MIVGHRWDMDVDDIIEFDNDNKLYNFWERVRIHSEKHACTGIDYFVYKRNQWKKLPDFIIGRPGFDNWLIWKARRRLFPVIDVTESLQVVHQNHPVNKLYKLEGDENKKLHNGKTLNILDATYEPTHVEDIVSGLVCVMEQGVKGNLYDLGRGVNYSINELASIFKNAKIEYVPLRKGEGEVTLADYEITFKKF